MTSLLVSMVRSCNHIARILSLACCDCHLNMVGAACKMLYREGKGQRGEAVPDGVLVQGGVGRGALIAAVGQLVRRCPRALQIHQLWCGPCCQSCICTFIPSGWTTLLQLF